MNKKVSRRKLLAGLGLAAAAAAVAPAANTAKTVVKKVLVSTGAPDNYDPTKHKWLMAIDANRCIGCGHCVEACKIENNVPEGPYFRTWIERYAIEKPEVAGESRGKVHIDSPDGGRKGFGDLPIPKEKVLHSFFVPKLCNLCEHSACVQVCPVGATFDTPDGAVLIDPKYCIGCGFCIQACPYGCRFMNPLTHTAEKCSLCYHRISRGLRPACVEVCPTEARLFGDMNTAAPDDPIQKFYRTNRVQTLKPHLGTEPRVNYAGLDKEVS